MLRQKKVSAIITCLMVLALLTSGFIFTTPHVAAMTSKKLQIADAHLHYVDFLQETDGIHALLRAMDDAGVQDVMISGLPLTKKWDSKDHIAPVYYLDSDSKVYYYAATDVIVANAIKSLPQQQQKRFHPFICGFNPTDKYAINHVKRMLEMYPNFWQGIGEIITRHGVLTSLTEGETATANNSALDPIFSFAGTHHLPVIIHSDLSAISVSQSSPYVKQPIYLPELNEALERHPGTTFIWAHAGLGRDLQVDNLLEIIEGELSAYKNLYLDISGFSYTYLINHQQVDRKWLALINKYPDRIMLGTDVVGHFGEYQKKIGQYSNITRELMPQVAQKIAHDNFLSLFPRR